MAYLGDYAITENAAGGALSVVCNIPEHEVGDYLVCMAAFNGNAGTFGMTGWTQIGTTQANATNISSAVFFIYCDTTSKTGTLTVTTADDYTIKVMVVKDADATTFLAGTAISTNTAAASTFSSAAMTTTTENALVVYFHGLDGTTPQAHTDPGGSMFYLSSDSTGTTAQTSAGGALCWYMQRVAGTTPSPSWNMSVSGARTNHTFAIRNKVGGRIPAYIDDANSIAQTVVMGTYFATLNNLTFPAALTIANIGPGGTGKATVYDAAAAAADLGLNPYSSALASTPAATAATSVAGFEVTLTATRDMSQGFLIGTIVAGTQKMANYNHGSIAQGGTYIVLASSTTANTNYASYQVAARDSVPNTNERMLFSIRPSQVTTAFGTNGTFDPAAVKRLMFLSNCPTATITLNTGEWHHVTRIAAAGGDANFPVDSEGLAAIGASFRVQTIRKSGAAGLLSYVPIQIGGGDAINFQIDAGALQFPRIYDKSKKEINFHSSGANIGISYAGKSGDVIKHTNSVVTSASPYYWEINSAATSAATWDFKGLVVVGATVTLRPVMTFTNMSFADSASVTTNASTITSCSFDNSPILVSSPASASSITNSTIVSSGTGHGITITGTAANITLSNLTFTGYAGTNGSTGNEAIFVNIASGIMDITISGGNSPSIRTAGATVNVVSGATVTFTGLPVGTDIVILTAGTSTILQQVDAHGSTSYGWGYQGTPTVDVGFIKPGYTPFYIRNLALGSTNSSIPVSLSVDRNYT